jgi:hypothetical protein
MLQASEDMRTASIGCGPFFAFCCWVLAELQTLPKKLGSSFLTSTSRSLLLFNCAEVTLLPGLGSGVAGLLAFKRSVTSAIAFAGVNIHKRRGQKVTFGPYLVAVEEVWVCRVHIAGLHCDHIRHKLRCRSHSGLVKVDNNAVKALAQSRIPAESLLKTHQGAFKR